MRSIIVAGAITLCALTGSLANAADRWAQCELMVKDRTYIHGRCNVEDMGEGSFALGVLRDDQPIPRKGFYFAYDDVSGDTAEAKWNEDRKEMHANASLGTLMRKGACWVNDIAKICVR